jgi:hypothetical protein
MCSTAVTLGGGMTMVNGFALTARARGRAGMAVNNPASTHRAYSVGFRRVVEAIGGGDGDVFLGGHARSVTRGGIV